MSEIAQYDFFSYARRGAAAQLTTQDSLKGPLPSLRGQLQVDLDIGFSASTGNDATASTTAELYGPGDVLGFDPRHIVRTEPPTGTLNFEPSLFAAIEFHHPDFPWLFTPLAAGTAAGSGPAGNGPAAASPTGVRPWLALIVLADGEWKPYENPPAGVQAITVTSVATLPNLDDSWAWAHVQVSGGVPGDDPGQGLASLLVSEPGAAISRLLCLRRLEPDTHYSAFLVPAFEAGRVAGGLDASTPPGTSYAWDSTATSVDLPVYCSLPGAQPTFSFTTTGAGDFETLVRRLAARRLPAEVGIRQMDVSDPGWGLPAATSPPDGPALGLSGALRSPSTQDRPWTTQTPFRPDLAALINRGATPISDSSADPDPEVVPPIWGRWLAARSTVDWQEPGWLNELNTDPRQRAIAGLGSEVVRDQRSQILASAWEQIAGIERANQLLRQAQAARSASREVVNKHLASANDELALSLTSSVHSRILTGTRTVHATIADSRLPVHALSPAFRRIVRPLGPLRRRQGAPATHFAGLLGRLNDGSISPLPPLHPPGGMFSLNQVADGLLPPWIPAPLRGLASWLWLIVLLVALVAISVLLVLGGLLGFLVVAGAGAGAIALFALALLLLLLRARSAIIASSGLRFEALQPAAIASVPSRPGFQVSLRHQAPPPLSVGAQGQDSPQAAAFRRAVEAATQAFSRAPSEQPVPAAAAIPDLRAVVTSGLDPEITVLERLSAIVRIAPRVGWQPADPLEPVMVAPEFDWPMYEPLRDLAQENLLPGLSLVPADTVALLEENHTFIEAYLAGVNHELRRQLLFAGYPTDQRASSFRQFWDVRGYIPQSGDPTDPQELAEKLRDIPPIDQWAHQSPAAPQLTELGENAMHPLDPSDPDVVLLVRGELLCRYPNAQIYAAKASWQEGRHILPDEAPELHPLYRGTLSPDLTFFGFQLKAHEAKGNADGAQPGWFFVIQQQATQPCFGLEPPPTPYAQPEIKEWNDISWASFATDAGALEKLTFAPVSVQPANLQNLTTGPENPNDTQNSWGKDAAQTAYITYRRPVRVAIHASAMLP
jgi:hypothetical protein